MKHQTRNTELNPYKLKLVTSASAAHHGRHTADGRRTLDALYVVFGSARLGRPHSPHQITARSFHALLHNYATKSHWLQWDARNSPQNCASPLTITTPIPIPRPPSLTVSNSIRNHSAILPQYTFRTDTHTHSHRPTVGLGDRSVT